MDFRGSVENSKKKPTLGPPWSCDASKCWRSPPWIPYACGSTQKTWVGHGMVSQPASGSWNNSDRQPSGGRWKPWYFISVRMGQTTPSQPACLAMQTASCRKGIQDGPPSTRKITTWGHSPDIVATSIRLSLVPLLKEVSPQDLRPLIPKQ